MVQKSYEEAELYAQVSSSPAGYPVSLNSWRVNRGRLQYIIRYATRPLPTVRRPRKHERKRRKDASNHFLMGTAIFISSDSGGSRLTAYNLTCNMPR